jgi:hypothetical protein
MIGGHLKKGVGMATVQGVETRKFDVEIDAKQALIALAQELCVYHYFRNNYGQYYKIKDNKIYSYDDVSYHGSPSYEETLDSDNEATVNNYRLINEIAKTNNFELSWY